jgi:chromosome partitioning protein
LNIAGYLEKAGKKVLVVDCDPQANATLGLGINPDALKRSMYDVFMSGIEDFPTVTIPEIVTRTASGIAIAPSTLDLVGAEPFLYEREDRASILKSALAGLETAYDYILIDTPPSLGQFVINGLVAADYCIITLDSGIFAMHGVDVLTTIFSDIKESLGREIKADMVILTRWAVKTSAAAEATVIEDTTLLSFLKRIFTPKKPDPTPEEIRKREEETREMERLNAIESDVKKRFKTVFAVPYSPDIYEAQKRGMPISHFAPESAAAQCYKNIADEVMTWR